MVSIVFIENNVYLTASFFLFFSLEVKSARIFWNIEATDHVGIINFCHFAGINQTLAVSMRQRETIFILKIILFLQFSIPIEN